MARFDVSAQGTAGWLKCRLGHLTASRMAEAMAFTKKGEPMEARKKYQIELVAERMSDMATEKFVTAAMIHGIENEPIARERYEIITGNLVDQAGFAVHDTIEFFGCSVDGLVGDGLIEIKCPTTHNYVEILLNNVVPDKYKPQMTCQCLITGREWCDFVAFDPRVPEAIQIFVKRFTPTKEELEEVKNHAIRFLAEVDEMFDRIITGSF